MANPNEHPNRRTILRSIAAGTVTLAGLGAAGTASADHIRPGQCAKPIYDVQSWSSCYQSSYGPILEAGVEGTVFSECDNSSLVHFVPNDFNQEDGWIDDSYLEPC